MQDFIIFFVYSFYKLNIKLRDRYKKTFKYFDVQKTIYIKTDYVSMLLLYIKILSAGDYFSPVYHLLFLTWLKRHYRSIIISYETRIKIQNVKTKIL